FCLGASVLTLADSTASSAPDTIASLPRPARPDPSGTTFTYTYNWTDNVLYANPGLLVNGHQYDLKAEVFDCAGRSVTTTTSFFFDGLAGTTVRLELLNGVTIGSRTYGQNPMTFKATPQGPTATDIVGVEFYWKPITGPDVDN